MKLLYTDISYDMTDILVNDASQAANDGKRVFYIAPNSLSFEKERSVLERLPKQASFAITVTRFAQMARYVVLNDVKTKETIDDNGLAMIFYRALSSMTENDLKVFSRLKQDTNFISQLVDLYKELQRSNMTVMDLAALHTPEKQEDLLAIFTAVDDILSQGEFENESKLALFNQSVQSGRLDDALKNIVLVIDGFTRFSAEEEATISLLDSKCSDIIIGTYVSLKAYKSNFIEGNIYQASLEFLRGLAARFATKPTYVTSEQIGHATFSKLSKLFEAKHNFSDSQEQLDPEDKDHVAIWESINQKEEVEHVAKAIRDKLYQGYRYKDILVLLGDVDSYKLHIGKIFDKYDIPYYFGKAESMSDHPLVHLIDSLERVKRYNFRTEDVLNLFKSDLYGHLDPDSLDMFEQYVRYADLKGQSKFAKDFSITYQGASPTHMESMSVNQMRQQLVAPLEQLFKARKQLGCNLLQKLMDFFTAIELSENMSRLGQSLSMVEQEKHEQVWKTFSNLLEQVMIIFGQEKLTLDELLSLLRSGMMAADYRVVPATVDVVSVKSYDLVEPHSKPFVFALGMTQSHFPKISQNKSLIFDEERAKINALSAGDQRLDIVSQENLKKNHFAALSVFNAATKELVLSVPQIANDVQDNQSPYLLELSDFGVPVIEKGRNSNSYEPSDIGNYKALLSQVIERNHYDVADEETLSKDEETFWAVAVRYLRKKLAQEGITIPSVSQNDDMETKAVDKSVMEIRFPKNEPIHLSSSALTTFYNNQYKYFLQYVLKLQELSSIHPNAMSHGKYLHRIFEQFMSLKTEASFDEKLDMAIQKTNEEQKAIYADDQESRYSQLILETIARSTATILRDTDQLSVAATEKKFDLNLDGDVSVNGIIDRIDQLSDGSLGIVDYKSSQTVFDIQKFYNGLSPQLITYIQALSDKQNSWASDKFFGAMYLHMQESITKLADVKSMDKLVEKAHQQLTYKGIFLADEKEHLANGHYSLRESVYQREELDTLLNFNKSLYVEAAQSIREGMFAINPYSEDGKSVQGDQLKAITHFEADRHMSKVRKCYKVNTRSSAKKRQELLSLMSDSEEEK